MTRALLAPTPLALTTDRVAVAAVAALTAVAVIAAASVPTLPAPWIVDAWSRGVTAAVPLAVLITVALSVVLARVALTARSITHARVLLVLGGGLAGAVNAILSYSFALLLDGRPERLGHLFHDSYLLTRLALGSITLGCLFGVAYGPVVAAAVHARLAPSLDAFDRVSFAGGASLLLVGGSWALGASNLAGLLGGAGGALAAGFAATRLVARLRLLGRVRDGGELGLHVMPGSDAEEEAELQPLMRTSTPPTGVLVAIDASTPYRGARGVVKVALVPAPDEPFLFPRSFAGLLQSAAVEVGAMIVSIGIVSIVAGVLGICLMLTYRYLHGYGL